MTRAELLSHKFSGKGNPNWNGGVRRRSDGYIQVHIGTRAGRSHYETEHRLVAAKALGRVLSFDETVHHINMNPSDNRPENLLICTRAYNTWLLKRYAELFAREHFRA